MHTNARNYIYTKAIHNLAESTLWMKFQKISKLLSQGNISEALKFLDKANTAGLLTLTPAVMKELKQKHPNYAQIVDNCLLFGLKDIFPSSTFDVINEQIIFKSAMQQKVQLDLQTWTLNYTVEYYAQKTSMSREKSREKKLPYWQQYITHVLFKVAQHVD